MAAIQDLFKQLRTLEWRGLKVPITGRTVGFQHELAKHKYVFRDREQIEPLGARNLTFRYSIPMREDIVRGPHEKLFTQGLTDFLNACLDREPGDLWDPVHGKFKAVAVSYNETLNVLKRDGVDLEIDFIHAPETEELDLTGEAVIDLQSTTAEAGALDAQVARVDWQQEEPPEPTVDPLAAIDGALTQVQLAGDMFAAKMDAVAFNCDKLSNTIDELGDPEAWPLKQSAQRVKHSALHLKDTVGNPAEKLYEHTVAALSTISVVASTLGLTVTELLDHNPALAAGAPEVPKGTKIWYPGKISEAA